MSHPLSATAVHKRFGAVQALVDVSIELRAGEVHAIVGENGAGKSTLARILAGAMRPDAGELCRDGSPIRFHDPRAALAAGVGYVPQRPALVSRLSLVDNFILGDDGWRAARREAHARLERALDSLGVVLPVALPSGSLDAVQRQLGDLAISLARGAEVLLLDEPTSTLGPVQIERLTSALRRLATQGTAVGLITHRVAEVLAGCHRVTVLREGRVVHAGSTEGLTAISLGTWMVGERAAASAAPPKSPSTRVRLAVRDVRVGDAENCLLHDIRFEVRAGERVGVAGVGGAGQAALASVLAGLVRPAAGSVEVDGTDVTGDAQRARSAGLAFIPEDRATGLSLRHSIAENLVLFALPALRGRLGLRDRQAEARHARRVAAELAISPRDVETPVGTLSGGNQQKVLVGRELEAEPAVIVAHGPTRGLDLAAAESVRSALFAASRRHAAVLVLSSDLDELFALCERLLILAAGRLVADLDCSAGPPDASVLGPALAGADVTFGARLTARATGETLT